MAQSYLGLLGHLVVATHAARESGDLAAALQKGGLAKDRVSEGVKLAADAEELMRVKIDAVGEDRIREHARHVAVQELEMWMQTVTFLVKKAVETESVVDLVLGRALHALDHGVTVIARALRMMSMLRCDDRVFEALGGPEATREILNRGHALARKLYRASDIRLAPEGDEARLPVFSDMEKTREEMERWVAELATAAVAAAAKDVRLIGRVGLVPDGVGLPVGGTSHAVILHERGQTDPPQEYVDDCPGWSAGRQGRNRENLGKGWVTSEA